MTLGARWVVFQDSGRDLLNERWIIVPSACFVDAPGHRPKANAIIGRRRQNLGTGSAAQPRLETRLVEHDRHAIVNVSPVLGGQFAVGMTGLAGQNKTSIDGTLTAAVGPFAAMRPGSISDQRGGFGDLYPLASLRWNSGLYNFMTYMTGDIPVGLYDSSNLANLGIGHGAIDGGVGYTYFISKQFLIGAVGYVYKQLTADSGAAPILGPNESQVVGAGIFEPQDILGVRLGAARRRLEHVGDLRNLSGSGPSSRGTFKADVQEIDRPPP
jgi:hypothetical protein